MLLLCIAIIAVALIFDFTNGFHDAANSIATIVATKVLTPRAAVAWAALFNFMALFIFGTGVAKTVGSGMVDIASVTPPVILCGLLGAISWNLLTWWLGLPSSSSHALIGGYAGAAIAHQALLQHDLDAGFQVIIGAGWIKTMFFMLLAPVLGGAVGFAVHELTHRAVRRWPKTESTRFFGHMQLLSSAFLSLSHGGNDAQKTAGIIAGALLTGGLFTEFHVPYWVLMLSYLAMALGTLAGGWRIVQTMGFKLTELDTRGGFSAETGSALTIITATLLGLPVSTTHATTGAIMGTGFGKHEAAHWHMARRILIGWLLTIPASAAVGALLVLLF